MLKIVYVGSAKIKTNEQLSETLTAIAVPGKKAIVTAAIVFIAELSNLVAVAIRFE